VPYAFQVVDNQLNIIIWIISCTICIIIARHIQSKNRHFTPRRLYMLRLLESLKE